jgi:hypothetical protein
MPYPLGFQSYCAKPDMTHFMFAIIGCKLLAMA